MFSIIYKFKIRFQKHKHNAIKHYKNVKIKHEHFPDTMFRLMLWWCLYNLICVNSSMRLMLVTICFSPKLSKGSSNIILLMSSSTLGLSNVFFVRTSSNMFFAWWELSLMWCFCWRWMKLLLYLVLVCVWCRK